MWPTRRLCDLLGIDHPIIQAPMAGSATPELAAAVSNAGGLGSLGCGEMSGAELQDVADQMRAGTNRPFNLNFFAYKAPRIDGEVLARTRARLAPYYAEQGLGAPPESLPEIGPGFDDEKLAQILEIRPTVVSFHFGLPEPHATAALKDAGIRLICSATTAAEARAIEAAGFDAVIAQGWEAGGHRGSHEPSEPGDGVGGLALIPQVRDAVELPVIAAGGIGDGRGIAAAFALGASGVQLGTAFLSCPEAGTDAVRRAAIQAAADSDTVFTDAVSGRVARAKRSRYVEEMAADRRDRLPDFPTLYALSSPLREAAAAQGSDDFSFHLYGQAAALNRLLPATELVERLAQETAEVFAGLTGKR